MSEEWRKDLVHYSVGSLSWKPCPLDCTDTHTGRRKYMKDGVEV